MESDATPSVNPPSAIWLGGSCLDLSLRVQWLAPQTTGTILRHSHDSHGKTTVTQTVSHHVTLWRS
jgi:hypothetical protein